MSAKHQQYLDLFNEIDQEKDGEIYLKEVVLYLRALNEEIDNLEVSSISHNKANDLITSGKRLAEQIWDKGDGSSGLFRIHGKYYF